MRTDLDEASEYASHSSVYERVYARPWGPDNTRPAWANAESLSPVQGGHEDKPFGRHRRIRGRHPPRGLWCLFNPGFWYEFVLPIPSARLKADQHESGRPGEEET